LFLSRLEFTKMAGGEAPGARDLEQTPTWAVSVVCAAMIIVSIILDKVLHRTGQVNKLFLFNFFFLF